MKKDLIGGVTTFLTMAYIVIVNPAILSTQGSGMSFSGVLTATVLLAFTMTLLMGLYARLPFAVAPGMGINAFFTYSLIIGQNIPWPVALGMVFWAGMIFLIISATPLREKIARVIPNQLRIASAVGIGIFLAFIGLKNMGIVTHDNVTFVKLGSFTKQVVLSCVGFLIMALLMRKKSPFAILAGIVFPTITAIALGWVMMPASIFSQPDFHSVFFKLDIMGALKLSLVPAILSILFTDLFDSISTFVGVSQATGLTNKNGEPLRLREGLLVDAFATLTAGIFGTSSGTAFIESAAGIEAGGRTGRSAIVTAICFLPCLFIAPLVGIVPDYATGPALLLVGMLMFRSIREIKAQGIEEWFPVFLTIIMIPLTFSITQGILWGLISHVVLFTLTGRFREVMRV
ncbi:MAG: NCS2 family permease [Xanthomonadaceae bacterium]|nr:NCS2 family permease [Xanthomonadaceae bacterium]